MSARGPTQPRIFRPVRGGPDAPPPCLGKKAESAECSRKTRKRFIPKRGNHAPAPPPFAAQPTSTIDIKKVIAIGTPLVVDLSAMGDEPAHLLGANRALGSKKRKPALRSWFPYGHCLGNA